MSQEYKLLLDSLADVKSDLKDMRDVQIQQHNKVQKIEVTMAKMCESIEYHIKRTNLLEEMVEPLHERKIKEEAIKDYKTKKREELVYKLKLPSLITGALVAAGLIVRWVIHLSN